MRINADNHMGRQYDCVGIRIGVGADIHINTNRACRKLSDAVQRARVQTTALAVR